MIGIKRLDRYIIGKFLLIFIGAFFICQFVFMMQFTWRYADDLIGKGLSLTILGQFFWYMAITLVPQTLPLSILLASLITFGNLGESLELLAMKAAGISLLRIMRPLACMAIALSGVSFYFLNHTSPNAQVSLTTLLFSMKQQSPAVEIPEGVFYNGVPGINLFVQHKQAETGMLYQAIIYKTDQGFDKAQIVLADSARMEITSDKMHLKLELWNGEQFESLQSAGGTERLTQGAKQPYDRETFQYKTLLIDFDSNFNLMDKDLLANMPKAKSMQGLNLAIDSINHELDSVGQTTMQELEQKYYRRPAIGRKDSLAIATLLKTARPNWNFDELMRQASSAQMTAAKQAAKQVVAGEKAELEWKSSSTEISDYYIRLHEREWHERWTLALACTLFFFVGAPLGAIIGKGGLGMPTVISVAIFIFWYIINTSSSKMARDGSINMVLGMWLSTMILTPIGVWITSRANRDSVVFNLDAWRMTTLRLLGLRSKRHVHMKEVIIDEPRRELLPDLLAELRDACKDYNARKHLQTAPNYLHTFFYFTEDSEVEGINERMEAIIEELSNSRNPKVLALLNYFPFLYTHAHTSPFHSRRMNCLAGVVLPVGFVLWLRIWRFRLRLRRDMRRIVITCDRLIRTIHGELLGENELDTEEQEAAGRKRTKRRWVKLVFFACIVLFFAALIYNFYDAQRKKMRRQATPTELPAAPAEQPTSSTPTLNAPLRLPSEAPSAQ